MTPVTFLLPVYNGEKYLKEALESIQHQTFIDFEVLVINDGSTDSTQVIIDAFISSDKRFRCISRENKGLIKTLNEGLDEIKTKYIARMDADDVCHPQRLELQLQYMENNPDIGVSGTYCKFFGQVEREIKYPVENEKLKALIPFASPFSHPSVILRRSVLEEHKLRYDENFKDCEDYKLWLDLSEFTKLGNIPDFLLNYRMHGESVCDVSTVQEFGSQLIRRLAVTKLKLPPTSVRFHLDLTAGRFEQMQLEYWPVYLADLLKEDKELFARGFASFRSFSNHMFPPAQANQFIDCVAEVLKAS
ncbi:MAG: glycosyltransferase [Lentisphaeraceae bacterium]|nr:glycosyltransferase [Lentisphaeraceae bacterium]